MGSEICNGVPEEELQRIEYNPDEDQIDEPNKNYRKGQPSTTIAYNINKLPEFLKESNELTKFQSKIAKLMAHEKRHIKPISISKGITQQNYLPDPYYIRSMEAIYIGEWQLDMDTNLLLPGGLGRLYTQQKIIQGEIMTEMPENQHVQQEDNIDFTQKMVMHNKQRANFFLAGRRKQISQSKVVLEQNYVATDFYTIDVFLHGQGRSFTRTSELKGNFVKGSLQGKAFCVIKEGEDIYNYSGQFKGGKKNGKGIQKFKLTSYDGDFENDQKNGKGTLTLLISHAYEKERLLEQNEISLADKEKDPSFKVEKTKEFIKKKVVFEEKLYSELNRLYPWVGPKALPKSMTTNQNFVIDHHRRGDFNNNHFQGSGTYTWFNGKVYNGEWRRGQMQGTGQFFWPKGIIYRGQYQKDMRHGKGQMIWSVQKRFRGAWAYGLRHGYGELIEVMSQQRKKERQSRPLQEQNEEGDPQKIKVSNLKKGEDADIANASYAEKKKEKAFEAKEDTKYYLVVRGVLFNKDKIVKEYFKNATEFDCDVKLQKLKQQQKQMIAFVKDIKM